MASCRPMLEVKRGFAAGLFRVCPCTHTCARAKGPGCGRDTSATCARRIRTHQQERVAGCGASLTVARLASSDSAKLLGVLAQRAAARVGGNRQDLSCTRAGTQQKLCMHANAGNAKMSGECRRWRCVCERNTRRGAGPLPCTSCYSHADDLF